jgi:hypothetical protein
MRPERFGPEQVTEARQRLGSRLYAAIHNQNPLPTEGSLFKASWFRYFTLQDGHYLRLGDKLYHVDQLTNRFLTVDHAVTVQRSAKHDPDFTVIASWLVTPCGLLVWAGCFIKRMEAPDVPREIARRYNLLRAQGVEIESGGTQKAMAQYCRLEPLSKRPGHRMNVWEFVPNRDKLDTASAALRAFEAGRIWLPGPGADRLFLADRDEPFPKERVEGELLRFTGGKQDIHDDCVTVVSMAARRLMRVDAQRPAAVGFKFQCLRNPVSRLIR